MAITYVNTTEIESIASDLISLSNEYIDEINKHKKSIFEFWKYSNKDAVASLDEGEEEEFNVKKLEKADLNLLCKEIMKLRILI